jgi:hypothetical protein
VSLSFGALQRASTPRRLDALGGFVRSAKLAPRWLLWACTCAAITLPSLRASACGVSVDGVWSCSLEEHDEALRRRWHVGASGVYTSTALRFGDGLRGDETRYATVATLAYAPSARLTFQASAGATFAGGLRMADGNHEFSPGPVAAVGVAYRLVEGRPFVMLTSLLSGSAARTRSKGQAAEDTGYEALDLRLGALAGTTLFDFLSPYAVARVFGGPVFWRYQGRARTGTDVYHYQLGAGLSLLIAQRVELFLEGVPLGERALSLGLAITL